MLRTALRFRADILMLTLALLTLPLTGFAKEESKIQIRLTDLSGNGNGNGNGRGKGDVRAAVQTHLQGTRVILKLRARGLESDTEYVLLCKDDESAVDSAELARFTSSSNGSVNVMTPEGLSVHFGVERESGERGLRLEGMILSVPSIEAVIERLAAVSVGFRELHGRVVVDAAPGQGCFLAFQEQVSE